MDITFGLTGVMWIGIALFLGILGWNFVNMGLSAGTKKLLKVGAVASILIATVALGYWATTPPIGDEGSITGVTWDTSCSSSDANVVQMSDYHFKVLCTYDISDGDLVVASQAANFTFVNTRADTNIVDATAIAKITDYGTQTNATTSQTYDGIEKNVDGSYNVVYTNSAGANTTNQIIVPTDKKTASDSFTLQLNPNVNAITAAPLYGGYIVTIVDAGQTYTIEFVHHATQA